MDGVGIDGRVGFITHSGKFSQGGRRAAEAPTGGDAAPASELQIENALSLDCGCPPTALRDSLRETLLMHRHQWVRIGTRVTTKRTQATWRSVVVCVEEDPVAGKTGLDAAHATENTVAAIYTPPNAAYRAGRVCKAYTACGRRQIEELDKRVKEQVMHALGPNC